MAGMRSQVIRIETLHTSTPARAHKVKLPSFPARNRAAFESYQYAQRISARTLEYLMVTPLAERRLGKRRFARSVLQAAGLQIVKRLMIVMVTALLCGPTRAGEKSEHPITHVYVLLGGLAG